MSPEQAIFLLQQTVADAGDLDSAPDYVLSAVIQSSLAAESAIQAEFDAIDPDVSSLDQTNPDNLIAAIIDADTQNTRLLQLIELRSRVIQVRQAVVFR